MVQGNWWILLETFNDQKQEGERLNCIAAQPSTVNVFLGECLVFITLNFNAQSGCPVPIFSYFLSPFLFSPIF